MTLRELWLMAHGRQQSQRAIVVAQAALVWVSIDASQLEEFVRCGKLDGGEKVHPYNPEALRQIQEQGLFR